MRSSCGCSRRAATIGARCSTTDIGLRERVPNVERLVDRDAETARDGQHRDGGAEVDVQLGPPFVDDGVDQGVDRLLDPVLDPPLRFGRHEGGLHQGPVTAVLGAAHRQHAVASDPMSSGDPSAAPGDEAKISGLR